MKLRHIPNIVTLFRLCLLAPFMVTLLTGYYAWTFYIFLVAGVSDGIDGWLARRYHWESELGGMLDPLSDKLFVATSYVTLGVLHLLPWWLVVIVITRDVVIVSGVAVWQFFIGPLAFNPSFLSKTNTVLQGFVILAVLFQLAYAPITPWLFNGLIIIIAITTCASLLDYIWMAYQKRYGQCKKSCN